MKKFKQVVRHHPWISLAFVLALLLAMGFAFRAIWMAVYWAGVEEKNPDLEAWMTPRYVMHTWDVKRKELKPMLASSEEEAEAFKDYTLGQIANYKQQNFADFSQQLQQQLVQLQLERDRDHGRDNSHDDKDRD